MCVAIMKNSVGTATIRSTQCNECMSALEPERVLISGKLKAVCKINRRKKKHMFSTRSVALSSQERSKKEKIKKARSETNARTEEES